MKHLDKFLEMGGKVTLTKLGVEIAIEETRNHLPVEYLEAWHRCGSSSQLEYMEWHIDSLMKWHGSKASPSKEELTSTTTLYFQKLFKNSFDQQSLDDIRDILNNLK